MNTTEERARLQSEYARREQRLDGSDKYSLLNQSHLFAIQQRQRELTRLLRQQQIGSIANRRILELGCGTGGVLLELLSYQATPAVLHGADVIWNRIVAAGRRLPGLPLSCADAQRLPYAAASFDLVLQFTVFSSIRDEAIWYNVAQEMLRVLKPDGVIVWYDFWLNPLNRETKGIRPATIRSLFSGCQFSFKRVTLAPPLARRLVPISWLAAALLEKLRLLNSHYLVAIRPDNWQQGAN